MIDTPKLYTVYRMHPRPDGTVYRQHAGGFYIYDGQLEVYSDPYHQLERLLGSGPIDPRKLEQLHRLETASYYDVVQEGPEGDIVSGSRTDLIPEAPLANYNDGKAPQPQAPAGAKPPPVFEYQRVGMSQPQKLEVYGTSAMLNGSPLTEEELGRIFENCRSGIATIRYPQTVAPPPEQVQKSARMARQYEALFKEEEKYQVTPEEHQQAQRTAAHFGKLDEAVKAGHVPEEVANHMRQLAYSDPLTGLGNKLAYKHFLANKKPGGVHVMLDANDFKPINEELGHETGDKAIGAMGGAIRQALNDTHAALPVADESSAGKAHRFGGDEFHVHLPTQEHAAVFARQLRNHLEAVPALNGTHHLGMSMGTGADPRTADQALDMAKKTMKQPELERMAGRKLGNGERPFDPKTGAALRAKGSLYAYSLHPSAPGPVPVDHNGAPPIGAVPPPMTVKETAARPPVPPPAAPGQPGQPAPAAAAAPAKPPEAPLPHPPAALRALQNKR